MQVYMPTLSLTPFMPDKLCRSVEDARRIAAENVLAHLPITVELTHNGMILYHVTCKHYSDMRSDADEYTAY